MRSELRNARLQVAVHGDRPQPDVGGRFRHTGSCGLALLECATSILGCAPSGGSYRAGLNGTTGGVGDAGVAAGTYALGACVSFGTSNAAGNLDQGQISLAVQGTGVSETVRYDPNALSGQFTVGIGTFRFTPRLLVTDTLDYPGAPGDLLINVKVQGFTADKSLFLAVDNTFITLVPVPVPAGVVLLGKALAGLRALRRVGRT